MVIIGSARIDENGKISGGVAGDQNEKEVSKQNWYLHNKGWFVLRAKDKAKREKIANCMEFAVLNPNIGYDQNQNTTLYYEAKKHDFNCAKVDKPCETDCARLVRVCVLYAGIQCNDFYTGTLKNELMKTNAFELFADDAHCKSPDLLQRGDILVTRTKGHVVVALTTGDVTEDTKMINVQLPTLRTGCKGIEVTTLQHLLEINDYSVGKYGCDGDFGNDTEKAVMQYQNKYHLEIDGIVGCETWSHLIRGK